MKKDIISRRNFLKNLGRIVIGSGLTILSGKLVWGSIQNNELLECTNNNRYCKECRSLGDCALPQAKSYKFYINKQTNLNRENDGR